MLFRSNIAAGIKVVHVAFKGGPDSMIEVLAGRAHYHLGTLGTTLPFIKEGKLTALAVTSPQRTPVLPDVPALGETHAEFKRPETSHGLVVPTGTPRDAIRQLGAETVRIVESAGMREHMQLIGFVPTPGGPDEYSKVLRSQIETMGRLVQIGRAHV